MELFELCKRIEKIEENIEKIVTSIDDLEKRVYYIMQRI